MRNSSQWIAIGLALVLAVVSLFQVNRSHANQAAAPGSGAPAAQQDSKLFEVLKRGKVIVGVTSEVPPFGFVDDKTNELAGFDIDLAHLVAKSLFNDPNKIELKKVAFANRWAAANNGEIDLGIMVTTVWPDRLARVNFTRGYVRSGLAMLVRGDVGVNDYTQLNDPKYTVAILDTPDEKDFMKEKLPKAKTLMLSSEADLLTAVRTDRAVAMFIDTPVAAWRAQNLPNLKSLGVVGAQTEDSFFLRQNDFQWWLYLDSLVGEMRCGSMYDDYAKIYQKWFGVQAPPPESCMSFSRDEMIKSLGGK